MDSDTDSEIEFVLPAMSESDLDNVLESVLRSNATPTPESPEINDNLVNSFIDESFDDEDDELEEDDEIMIHGLYINNETPEIFYQITAEHTPNPEHYLSPEEIDRYKSWMEARAASFHRYLVAEGGLNEDRMGAKERRFYRAMVEFGNKLNQTQIDKPWLARDIPRPLTDKQFTYLWMMSKISQQTNQEPTRMTTEARTPRLARPYQRTMESFTVYVDPEFATEEASPEVRSTVDSDDSSFESYPNPLAVDYPVVDYTSGFRDPKAIEAFHEIFSDIHRYGSAYASRVRKHKDGHTAWGDRWKRNMEMVA